MPWEVIEPNELDSMFWPLELSGVLLINWEETGLEPEPEPDGVVFDS